MVYENLTRNEVLHLVRHHLNDENFWAFELLKHQRHNLNDYHLGLVAERWLKDSRDIGTQLRILLGEPGIERLE